MTKDWVRTIAVAAILMAGGLWVLVGQRKNSTVASATDIAVSSRLASQGSAGVSGVSVPWGNKADDSTPIVKLIHSNPSPAGKQVLTAFKNDKAAVLVCLPPQLPQKASLRSWIQQCGDYCKTLGEVVMVDSQDRREKPLLRFLKADGLKPPIVISIANSGEVQRRLSGDIKRQDVINLFAKVTGACGVNCEKGSCD